METTDSNDTRWSSRGTRDNHNVDSEIAAAPTSYETFAGAWPERDTAGGEDAGLATALDDARKIAVSNQQLELTSFDEPAIEAT